MFGHTKNFLQDTFSKKNLTSSEQAENPSHHISDTALSQSKFLTAQVSSYVYKPYKRKHS
jgi:hypothetical protein